MEEARVAARGARERALDDAKADYDKKVKTLGDKHDARVSQLQVSE